MAASLGVWLAAALWLGRSGRYPGRSAIGLGATVGGILVGGGLVWVASGRLRRWATALQLDRLTWFHVWRLADGLALLALYHQGRLPWRLAGPSGLGEVALALTAPAVARLGRADTVGRLGILFAWHALGAVNVLSLTTTAIRLAARQDPLLEVVASLPGALLPTFVVPLALVTHAVALAAIWVRPLGPAGRS